MIREEKVRDRAVRMEVGDCVESEHYLLIVTLRSGGGEEGEIEEERGERIREKVDCVERGDNGVNKELKM